MKIEEHASLFEPNSSNLYQEYHYILLKNFELEIHYNNRFVSQIVHLWSTLFRTGPVCWHSSEGQNKNWNWKTYRDQNLHCSLTISRKLANFLLQQFLYEDRLSVCESRFYCDCTFLIFFNNISHIILVSLFQYIQYIHTYNSKILKFKFKSEIFICWGHKKKLTNSTIGLIMISDVVFRNSTFQENIYSIMHYFIFWKLLSRQDITINWEKKVRLCKQNI